jgi:hypothetical protein
VSGRINGTAKKQRRKEYKPPRGQGCQGRQAKPLRAWRSLQLNIAMEPQRSKEAEMQRKQQEDSWLT